MRRSTIFVATVCTMAAVLMANRCSSDDDVTLPASARDAPADPDDLSDLSTPGAGIGKDPRDEVTTGTAAERKPPVNEALPGDEAPSIDEGGAGSESSLLDDQTFEPQPVPEGAVDTTP